MILGWITRFRSFHRSIGYRKLLRKAWAFVSWKWDWWFRLVAWRITPISNRLHSWRWRGEDAKSWALRMVKLLVFSLLALWLFQISKFAPETFLPRDFLSSLLDHSSQRLTFSWFHFCLYYNQESHIVPRWWLWVQLWQNFEYVLRHFHCHRIYFHSGRSRNELQLSWLHLLLLCHRSLMFEFVNWVSSFAYELGLVHLHCQLRVRWPWVASSHHHLQESSAHMLQW